MRNLFLALFLSFCIPLFPTLAPATVVFDGSEDRYVGNGSATAYTYNFKILSSADIKVLVNGVVQTLSTHYSVSGVGASNGGTVTFVTAPANGLPVTLMRNQPVSQLTNYTANSAYNALTVMRDFDKQTMVGQMLAERAQRTLLLGEKSTYSALTIPDPVSGNFVRWKSDLTGLENVTLVNIVGTGLSSGQVAFGAGTTTPLVGSEAFKFANNRLTITTPTPSYDLLSNAHSASQYINLGAVTSITDTKAVDGMLIEGTLATTTSGAAQRNLTGIYVRLTDSDNGDGDHRVRGILVNVDTTATAGTFSHILRGIHAHAAAVGTSDANINAILGQVTTIATTPALQAYSFSATQTGTAGLAVGYSLGGGDWAAGLDFATFPTTISDAALILKAGATTGKIRWNDANSSYIRVGATSGQIESNALRLALTTPGSGLSIGVIPAATGDIRLATGVTIKSRNSGDSADIVIADTGSDQVNIGNTGSVLQFRGTLSINAAATINATKTVRAAGGASDCTLIFSHGLLTGGSC